MLPNGVAVQLPFEGNSISVWTGTVQLQITFDAERDHVAQGGGSPRTRGQSVPAGLRGNDPSGLSACR